jgi:hypothetical protein
MSKSWYVVSVRKYRLYLTNSIVALFMSKYNRFKCFIDFRRLYSYLVGFGVDN